MGYIRASDFGVVADGVTPDTLAWNAVIAEWKATGKEIVLPKGGSVVTDTVLFDNVGTDYFNQGPRIISPYGPLGSYFIGSGISGKPVMKIDGRNPSCASTTYFSNTKIECLGIRQDGTCTMSDAFEYHATWHSTFEEIRIKDASNRGVFAANPKFGTGNSVGDNNASSQVDFIHLRVENCKGPAWSSAGSWGGIANHTFKHFHAINNASETGGAQIDIDGALHINFDMTSAAAFNNLPVPLVKVRGTNLYPDTVVFQGGEFGNASGDHFVVEKALGMCVRDIRQIRRGGETAARYGFLLDNANGRIIRDLTVTGVVLAVEGAVATQNTTAVPFTWMKKTGGPLETSPMIYSPSMANSPGVVVYEGFP